MPPQPQLQDCFELCGFVVIDREQIAEHKIPVNPDKYTVEKIEDFM